MSLSYICTAEVERKEKKKGSSDKKTKGPEEKNRHALQDWRN